MKAPLFTVFTPTYNRADKLGGVFRCLYSQTCRDFEWLIVDDGSSDDTVARVRQWQQGSDFSVRYVWQENGGKHRAFNRGVREAGGELFLTLDSDDTCTPDALERFRYHWESIPIEQRDEFSAVTSLCMDVGGKVVGDRFPDDIFDSEPVEIFYRHGVGGEKWGFQRTDILRQFPFPEIGGEKFVPEALVWNRIGRHYRTRYINEALRIYEIQEDSLSLNSARLRMKSPGSTSMYYRELLDLRLPAWGKVRAAANYVRFSLHSGKSLATILAADRFRVCIPLSIPFAVAYYLNDLLRSR